jgi:hypothetical protein
MSSANSTKGLKRGPKDGGTRNEITKDSWYAACVLKNSSDTLKRMSIGLFLKSNLSGEQFTGTKSQQVLFAKYLKKYENGELRPLTKKRVRQSKYVALEEKLVKYIRLRQSLYHRDKCGLSWVVLEKKLADWATIEEDEAYNDFKASPGFISRVLKDHNLIGVSLHGEANDMNDEEREGIMADWRVMFWKKLEDRNIGPECLYNGDQSGLFYNKMPNRMYIDKHRRKSTNGVKAMKSKDRITMMVCTSCNGKKAPISVIGKANKPKCFQLCPNETPPLPYRGQSNAWFDKSVMMWWICNVFWPFHLEQNGDVPAILLLDNFSGQTNLEKSSLPRNLEIIYFPENVTNTHQPADMGIIASLKVGYKIAMLEMFLAIFDVEGGYEDAAAARRHQKRGCKGIQYGGKAHVLDAMNILNNIWGKDGKYASEDSVRRCWRKADILPPTWMADINNEVGSGSLSMKDKKISDEDCDLLCSLMKNLRTKVTDNAIDMSKEGYAMQGSFVEEISTNDRELQELATQWIDIENDEFIQEAEIDEAIQELEMNDVTENENVELSDNDPMENEVDDNMDVDGNQNSLTNISSFLEASWHIEKLRRFGESIGASSQDLDLLSKLERSFRQIQLSKARSQPTITRFFSIRNSEAKDEEG